MGLGVHWCYLIYTVSPCVFMYRYMISIFLQLYMCKYIYLTINISLSLDDPLAAVSNAAPAHPSAGLPLRPHLSAAVAALQAGLRCEP